MAGKWGSNGGGGMRLPAGLNTAQVVSVQAVLSTKLKDQGKDPEQFEWSVQVWVGGKWEPRKIWTGRSFQDPSSISAPQFVPKLMKLVRACGQPLPTTASEATSWREDSLVGHRFGILMQPDPEDPSTLRDYIVPLQQQPTPAPPPGEALLLAPPPPPAAVTSPDPFGGTDPGSTPPPALVGASAGAAAVTGDADIWK